MGYCGRTMCGHQEPSSMTGAPAGCTYRRVIGAAERPFPQETPCALPGCFEHASLASGRTAGSTATDA